MSTKKYNKSDTRIIHERCSATQFSYIGMFITLLLIYRKRDKQKTYIETYKIWFCNCLRMCFAFIAPRYHGENSISLCFVHTIQFNIHLCIDRFIYGYNRSLYNSHLSYYSFSFYFWRAVVSFIFFLLKPTLTKITPMFSKNINLQTVFVGGIVDNFRNDFRKIAF